MTLLTGTLLARGCRTVAAALRASGNDQVPNWSNFHQVLNRARWSPLAVGNQSAAGLPHANNGRDGGTQSS
ncbi:MAG TPA: hypothetical protein VIY29_07185 [Ktedonobacteraceae bacterium]